MTENAYRLLLGMLLFLMLYIESDAMAYTLIAMTFFEGVTNWRLNLVVSKILHKITGHPVPVNPNNKNARIPIDSERAQRFAISIMFYLTYFVAPEEYWVLNWFFAVAILLSGIVMFCPVVSLFRYLGFR